jgi:MGT family glycosyltransferase
LTTPDWRIDVDRKHFLFVSWEGGGNVPPAMAVARRLVDAGHAVTVLGEPSIAPEVRAARASFRAFERAPHRADKGPESDWLRDFEATRPGGGLEILRDRLMIGPAPAYARDTLEAIEAVRPDAVVVAEFLFGAQAAAESAGLPTAVFAPNVFLYPAKGRPAFGPGFPPPRSLLERGRDAVVKHMTRRALNRGLASLNRLRADLGLEPVKSVLDQAVRCDRFLVATSARFDFPAETLPPQVRYVGPILDDPSWVDAIGVPLRGRADAPLVVVGFSTTEQKQRAALARVIEALGALDVRGVVTTGPAIAPSELPAPPNVLVLRSAPHSALLREAAAFVTHAGHGSVIRALAHGVPQLCLPMGRDQNDNACRVAVRGAGLRLTPDAAAAAVREAIARLLAEPGFRRAAGELGAAVRSEAARSKIVQELVGLASHRPSGAGAGAVGDSAARAARTSRGEGLLRASA